MCAWCRGEWLRGDGRAHAGEVGAGEIRRRLDEGDEAEFSGYLEQLKKYERRWVF